MSASSLIRPFPKTAVYATSWSQPVTFEQLYDDLAHYPRRTKLDSAHKTGYIDKKYST